MTQSDDKLLKLQQELEDLQSQLAFQEDTLTQLNEVVSQQAQDLLLQQRQLVLLKQQLDEQSAGKGGEVSGEDPAAEVPPHY